MSFRDRVVLITGAGAGIGKQFSRALLAEGARVGAIDRREDLLSCLEQDLPGKRLATALADVTDPERMRQAVTALETELGPADLLIANAGIIHEMSALAFRPDLFEAEVRVNLIGVANSFAAVLPGMCARRSGHVAALSSIASYRGVPRLAGYCASKAGVNALCDAFRVELRPLGIRVTTLCPGFIRTGIADHLESLPDLPYLTVEDAVGRMLGALRRGKVKYTFPASQAWYVRLLRALPRWLSDALVARDDARFQRGRKSVRE